MKKRIQLARNWHYLCVVYYRLLLESCLDESQRFKLSIKLNQHKNKLADLEFFQAG
ncbi:hypothetical protein [Paenibacillus sp. 1011MAR3C5]|uniref:hypothetical protein n=1 Tax=Paenibacillus sp. 1011MAR3C5 TaxID=1675787 RepID=UPI0015FEC4A1|nr:hypothetical protein [Paenibacillus sp. 1011MAR3C5]